MTAALKFAKMLAAIGVAGAAALLLVGLASDLLIPDSCDLYGHSPRSEVCRNMYRLIPLAFLAVWAGLGIFLIKAFNRSCSPKS